MICASTRRCAFRAPCPGVLGRSKMSLSGTSGSNPAPIALLQPLGVELRDLEAVDDVGGDVAAGAEQRAGVPDLPVVEDRDVGRTAAQLDDGAAQLDLVRRQHRRARPPAAPARTPAT